MGFANPNIAPGLDAGSILGPLELGLVAPGVNLNTLFDLTTTSPTYRTLRINPTQLEPGNWTVWFQAEEVSLNSPPMILNLADYSWAVGNGYSFNGGGGGSRGVVPELRIPLPPARSLLGLGYRMIIGCTAAGSIDASLDPQAYELSAPFPEYEGIEIPTGATRVFSGLVANSAQILGTPPFGSWWVFGIDAYVPGGGSADGQDYNASGVAIASTYCSAPGVVGSANIGEPRRVIGSGLTLGDHSVSQSVNVKVYYALGP